jgi:hypothetical protein
MARILADASTQSEDLRRGEAASEVVWAVPADSDVPIEVEMLAVDGQHGDAVELTVDGGPLGIATVGTCVAWGTPPPSRTRNGSWQPVLAGADDSQASRRIDVVVTDHLASSDRVQAELTIAFRQVVAALPKGAHSHRPAAEGSTQDAAWAMPAVLPPRSVQDRKSGWARGPQ